MFKEVYGFSKYEINKKGEVRNKETKHVLKHAIDKDGYIRVTLSNDDCNQKTTFLHRIMMMTFKPHEDMLTLQVNHIDGNKKNFDLENLEWCTAKENAQHAHQTGLINKDRYLSEETKNKIKSELITGPNGNYKELVKKYNITFAYVYQIVGQKKGVNGENNGRALLSKEQVIEIRNIYSKEVGFKELAKKYGVNPNTISNIIKRKSWINI